VRGDVAVGLESHGRRKLFCTQFLPKVARGVNWAGNSVIDAKPGIGSTKQSEPAPFNVAAIGIGFVKKLHARI
jgi:hypothetical protein